MTFRVGLGARSPGPPEGAAEEWRLFIAVPLPPDVRNGLERVVEQVRASVPAARWQRPDTWHLTLRFLGQTPTAAVRGLENVVRRVAASQAPFRAELRGTGLFGRPRGGGVVWIGVGSGGQQLTALAAVLGREIDPAHAAEERPLQAHLTLAREAPGGTDEALRAALAGVPPLAWTADRLVLYRSVLGRSGAQHTELASAAFGEPVTGV